MPVEIQVEQFAVGCDRAVWCGVKFAGLIFAVDEAQPQYGLAVEVAASRVEEPVFCYAEFGVEVAFWNRGRSRLCLVMPLR